MDIVSIIVPVYNVERWLPNCMYSLLNQTYFALEIILVDDGAKDSSGQLCDEYALKDKRIQVFHKENGGVASARNLGLDKATGKYICFVDPDDCINEHAIETWVTLQKDKNVDLIVSAFLEETIINGKVVSSFETRQVDAECQLVTTEMNNTLVTLGKFQLLSTLMSKLFLREIIKENKIRFSNLVQYEDHCFVLDYLKACKNLYITQDTFYMYRRYLAKEHVSLTNHFQKNNRHIFYVYKKERDIVEEYGIGGQSFELEAEKRVIYSVTNDIGEAIKASGTEKIDLDARLYQYKSDESIDSILKKYSHTKFDILTNALLSYINRPSSLKLFYIKLLQYIRKQKGKQ